MNASFVLRAGRALLGAVLVGLLATSAVLAAGPTREVADLNDPALDVDESAFATDFCGFPVDADVSGHIGFLYFPGEGAQSVQELHLYAVRIAYTNPATGITVQATDVGPDRFYVKKGHLYIAITGRSFNIGVFIIDLETDEVVHQAGKANDFYDTLCAELAG
jgi:hypothetical protein